MAHRIFINVHKIQQAYGGPEEGGWYYEKGTYLYSRETAVCVCSLALTMLWRDLVESQHEETCRIHALVEQTRQEYASHRDEWIPQEPGDDSPERVGEVFKTGVIEVSLSATMGFNFPNRPPTYA